MHFLLALGRTALRPLFFFFLSVTHQSLGLRPRHPVQLLLIDAVRCARQNPCEARARARGGRAERAAQAQWALTRRPDRLGVTVTVHLPPPRRPICPPLGLGWVPPPGRDGRSVPLHAFGGGCYLLVAFADATPRSILFVSFSLFLNASPCFVCVEHPCIIHVTTKIVFLLRGDYCVGCMRACTLGFCSGQEGLWPAKEGTQLCVQRRYKEETGNLVLV